MPKRIHLIAGILAPICIAAFFSSTVLVELFGSHAAVAHLKSLIVTPGLCILIPCLAAAAGTGMYLGKSRRGRLVDNKKARVPFIAANGLLVLVPCAIVLNRWASAGSFDTTFYVVQALELLAGATNVTLLALNVRDGLRLTARLRASAAAPARPS